MHEDLVAAVAKELHLESSAALGAVEFHGDSMLPLLRDGDALRVEPASWESLRPGDVVVYRFDDRYPALRIAEKLADKLFLTADNWPSPIFEAWRDDVLGRVTGYRRAGRDVGSDAAAWRRAATRARLKYRVGGAKTAVRRKVRALAKRVRADVAALRAGMVGMPEALQLNVSSVCNLTCRMCPYLGVHQDDAYLTFMSPETFERLLPTVKTIGAVHFSGSGEPLYNKHLLSFMDRVRTECPKARVGLITNGTLLRRDVAAELVRIGLDSLTVSIDGSTAPTVESIRRHSDFELIVENVRQLSELKRERGSPRPRIFANYMLGYGTYRELPDFVRLAKRVGIEEVHLLEIQPSCAGDVVDNLAAGMQQDEGRRLRYAIQLGQRLGVTIVPPVVSRNACLFPYHPHVSESGEVYPCCYMDYDGRTLFDGTREVRLSSLSFGNTDAAEFRKAWNAPAYRTFRRRNKTGDFPGHCRTCYDIRATTADQVGRILGPRPLQPGRA
jgi:MoaA/NifB/PqqE/SkfB family radical SAM enzyme